MKRIAWTAAVLMVFSASLWAQAAKPAAKEAAKPAETKTADTKTADAKPARKSRANEDCRFCLEKGSNTEIIKCAEQYL